MPKPRPAEAPAAQERAAPGEEGAEEGKPDSKPADQAAAKPEAPPQPKPPSACRVALTDQLAIAPSIPDITGPGACGGTDLVKLEAVVMPDGSHVAVTPAATLRCDMAREVVDWVRDDVSALAVLLNTKPAVLDNFDSYECRGRNRQKGGILSEHGKANAIDIRLVKMTDGRSVSPTDRSVPRAWRDSMLQSVCARFTTVLGPGSDGYHEDHIHLDLAQRRGGYRICHWEVWEGLPQIAPLLPPERPAEAPPRETAANTPTGQAPSRDDSREAPEQSEPQQAEQPEAAEPPAAPPPAAKPAKPPKKHRAERSFRTQ
ncbi:extensin family protein [Rhodopseudomonas sp. B29]|uniref:extensin-like domain-containing protein n=1 Tax=Rhodopseudomonas sp. B29 TaxID=95607 RepID=UPI0027D8F2E3|nr:extensin family protein [Rhodopseudomonas sp. B29]